MSLLTANLSGPFWATLFHWGISQNIFFSPLLVYKEAPHTLNCHSVSWSLYCTVVNLAATMIITVPYHFHLSRLSRLHLLFVYCPLLGTKFCHTFSIVFKARPFGLIKSSVLDSTILRERHKISLRRLYWLCHLVIHSNCSMARLKTLMKTKQLDSNYSW